MCLQWLSLGVTVSIKSLAILSRHGNSAIDNKMICDQTHKS